jgi:2-phosphosulfolactate phosphatase
MEFQRMTLDTCPQATGAVVVIDVLRAFSTAAYAFGAGAEAIFLTRTVEQALELRARLPGAQVMGEVDGLSVPDFDYSNSPAQLDGANLSGRNLIQRTSSGTQGVVLSQRADTLLAASFVCASATARYIHQLAPQKVSFVVTGAETGQRFDGAPIGRGDEDAACADYLESLVREVQPNPDPFIRRVWESPSGLRFADPDQPEFPAADLEYCIAVDRFNFAMPVQRRDGLLVMRASNREDGGTPPNL